jgi:hypothetical protein
MGQYCNFEQVRLRLAGKVRIDMDGDDPNLMSAALANKLIGEAEGQLEFDLSPRYSAPFQTDAGAPFAQLPQHPTQTLIKTLAELQSVIRILETDFGSGTIVDSEKYIKRVEERYKGMLEQLLEKKSSSDYLNWKYPPLPGLQLAAHNIQDDGFSGQVLVSSDNRDGGFPKDQINDPARNLWNAFGCDDKEGW